jgi:hypothetical protein
MTQLGRSSCWHMTTRVLHSRFIRRRLYSYIRLLTHWHGAAPRAPTRKRGGGTTSPLRPRAALPTTDRIPGSGDDAPLPSLKGTSRDQPGRQRRDPRGATRAPQGDGPRDAVSCARTLGDGQAVRGAYKPDRARGAGTRSVESGPGPRGPGRGATAAARRAH